MVIENDLHIIICQKTHFRICTEVTPFRIPCHNYIIIISLLSTQNKGPIFCIISSLLLCCGNELYRSYRPVHNYISTSGFKIVTHMLPTILCVIVTLA